MKFGYARISTTEQKFDLQLDSLLKEDISITNIFKDVASGAREERKGLDNLLEKLREGDILVVWKLDRIARSVVHMTKLITEFEKRKIQFRSIQEPFIDTSSSHGKFIFNIFSAVAQLERDLIIDRTNAGLTAALKRGRKGGRPFGLSPTAIKKVNLCKMMYKDNEMSVTEICKFVGVSRKTFYKYLKTKI